MLRLPISLMTCLTAACLTALPAHAATVSTFARVELFAPEVPPDVKNDVPYTTDQLISGPVNQESNVARDLPFLPARLAALSYVNSVADFGASAQLALLEGGPGLAQGTGAIEVEITRQSADITSIPYTVSQFYLGAERGTTAEASFAFAISDPLEPDPDTVLAIDFATGRIDNLGVVTLNNNLGIASGPVQAPEVPLSLMLPLGFNDVTRDVATLSLPSVTGALDISFLDVGREYLLTYSWAATVEGRFGAAQFIDPLSLPGGGGALSLDAGVMAELTGAAIDPRPSPVPLPASFAMLLAGIGALVALRRETRSGSRSPASLSLRPT